MRRSRAFMLSEQMLAIMLQASFILVLCISFYGVMVFYEKTQQLLTARNHAEGVISFVSNRIQNAGLGLWRCTTPAAIRGTLGSVSLLNAKLRSDGTPERFYRLPVSLKWYSYGMHDNESDFPPESANQDSGDVLTLLYAQRDLSSGSGEIISAFRRACKLTKGNIAADGATALSGAIPLLDNSGKSSNRENFKDKSLFTFGKTENIKSYAAMEGFGLPLYLHRAPYSTTESVDVKVFLNTNFTPIESRDIIVPAGGELMVQACMQMFVHDPGDGNGRQFAFRELDAGGIKWDKTYNQEVGILDMYMELDTSRNTFTLYVLGTGGYDNNATNPRPETWPDKATWTEEYSHHTVYVSRATWKLHNIPPNFTW